MSPKKINIKTKNMKNVHSILHLFGEQRMVFENAEIPKDLQTLRDKEKTEKDQQETGESAAKEFKETINAIKDGPEKVWDKPFAVENLPGGDIHYIKILEQGLIPNVGGKLFPLNPDLAKKYGLEIGKSYAESVGKNQEVKAAIDNGKIDQVEFKAQKGGFLCTAKEAAEEGKNQKSYDFEVPFKSEFFEQILQHREEVKKAAIEQRKVEQESMLSGLLNDKFTKARTDVQVELGAANKKIDKLIKSDNKETVYQISQIGEKETLLPFAIVFKNEDPSQVKLAQIINGSIETTEEFGPISSLKKSKLYRNLLISELDTARTETEAKTKVEDKKEEEKATEATGAPETQKTEEKEEEQAKQAKQEKIEEILKEKELSPFEKLLQEAGVTITEENKKIRISFNVEGVQRGFLATKAFVDSLGKLKTAKDVNITCYKKLLSIIKSDNSIKTNKHEVAGGNEETFKRSNQTMAEYVRTKGEIEKATEAEKKGYTSIGTFGGKKGIELFVSTDGKLYTADGAELAIDQYPKIQTELEDVEKSPQYKTGLQRIVENQPAATDGKEFIGIFEGEMAYVNDEGVLYDKNNAVITDAKILNNEKIDQKIKHVAELRAKEKKIDKTLKETKEGSKEKLEAKIKRILLEIQRSADRASDNDGRTVRLNQKFAESPFVYNILVEGKETPYVVEIAGKTTSEEPSFTIRKNDGKKAEYKTLGEWGETDLDAIFGTILDETIDEREVENVKEELEKLSKKGLKINKPEKIKKLRKQEWKELDKATSYFSGPVELCSNVQETIRELESAGEALKKSGMEEVEFQYLDKNPTIKWSKNEPLSWGFGNKDDLTNKLLEIKKAELGEDSEEYKIFLSRSRTRNEEEKLGTGLEHKKAKYLETYEKITATNYPIDINIGKMSEEDIVANWDSFGNTRKGVEYLMKNPPFGIEPEKVESKAAEIISKWRNDRIDFGDIFDSMNGFPEVEKATMKNPEGIPQEYLKNADEFLKGFKGLLNKKNKTETEARQLDNMFNGVLVPCLELLEKMATLRFDPEAAKEREGDDPEKNLSEDQKKILKGLKTLASFSERTPGGWEKFLRAISKNGEKKITMQNIDGEKFALDEGVLRRHFSPDSVWQRIIDRAGGLEKMTDESVTKEINRLMLLGYIQLKLAQELGKTDKKYDMTSFKINSMKDFEKFTPEQMYTFQLGFIIDQEKVFKNQINEGVEALSGYPPAIQKMVEQLIQQGLDEKYAKEIGDNLLLMAGATFKNGQFESAMLGKAFDLKDGATLVIGVGVTKSGQVVSGLAFSFDIVKANGVKVALVCNVGVTSIGVGSTQTIEAGKLNIHLFEGVQWSWDSVIPTAGGSIGLSWNMNKEYQERLKETSGEDLTRLWSEWKKLKTPAEKYEKLKAIPQIWLAVATIQSETGATNEDMVYVIESFEEEISSWVLEKLRRPFPLLSYAGFGMMGPIPVPQVGIKFGSMKVFIPNRKEIAKMLDRMSNARATTAVKKALEEMEKRTFSPDRFIEQTERVVYSKDGELMILQRKDEVDLSSWDTSIESYNQALKETDISLKEVSKGKIELIVDKTEYKDVEIHPDPLLHELGMVVDNGRTFIMGNIDDLIITRERFYMPFESGDKGATTRDYIYIRQKDSLRGNRDRLWAEKYEAAYVRKLMNEKGFYVERGANPYGDQVNLFEVKGWAEGSENLSEEEQKRIQDYLEHQPSMEGRIDKEDLERKEGLLKGRSESMQNVATDKASYEKPLENTEELFGKLYKLYESGFSKAVGENIGDTGALIKAFTDPKYAKLVKEAGLENITKVENEKQLNLAVTYMMDLWFSRFYKGEKGTELSEKERVKLNKELKKSLEARVGFVRDHAFKPKFEEAMKNMEPKPTHTAEDMAKKVTDDMFGELLKKLDDPNFDFRTLKVEEIPGGSMFLSGSRKVEKGKKSGAVAETSNFVQIPHNEAVPELGDLPHALGFLEGTVKQYLPNAEGIDGEIGRVMLEIASPIPKEDEKFLRSSLALKIASLGVHVLLAGEEDYRLISEIYENSANLREDRHHAALERFKQLVKDIRAKQIEGKDYIKEIEGTGLTVKISMNPKIVAGGYTKCANPSFYVEELGTVEVLKGQRVVGKYVETSEMVDVELTKIFASLGLALGFKEEKVDKNPEEGVTNIDEDQTVVQGGSGAEGSSDTYISGPSVKSPTGHTGPVK